MNDTNLLLIFITGLTTGGLSCVALQGGLLASALPHRRTLPTLSAFLFAKLLAYTLLGLLLGYVGSFFTLSPVTRGYFQLFIALYLAGVAGALLDIHPYFRYFLIKPPKRLLHLIKNETDSDSVFTPALLGLMTIFLPCATTQAMLALALSSGSPLYAAAIMFSFTLGTTPTFALLGFLFSRAQSLFKRFFYPAAATLMLLLALNSLNGGLTLIGSPYTFGNIISVLGSSQTIDAVASDTIQEVTINVTNNGYTPKTITLKSGLKTRLKLVTNNTFSCARAFVIPALDYQVVLPNTGSTVYEFTPDKPGTLVFSCSMGMYTGQFKVI